MKIYKLYRKEFLPVSVEEAWRFFSSPRNLQKITPSSVKLKMRTAITIPEIQEGLYIEYVLSPILRVPFEWITLVSKVDRPYSFTDIQLKGPFALWEHKHSFKPMQGGTEITDEVNYALPMGVFGQIAHTILIKRRLEEIFDFREKELKRLFKSRNV